MKKIIMAAAVFTVLSSPSVLAADTKIPTSSGECMNMLLSFADTMDNGKHSADSITIAKNNARQMLNA